MRDGCLQEAHERFGTSRISEGNRLRNRTLNGGGEPALIVDGLNLYGPGDRVIFEEAGLIVQRGERVHLHGLNGAGKSTLLRCMVGFQKAEARELRIVGIHNPRPERLVGKVGMLFQNPEKQLFADSVHEEVSYCMKRLPLSSQQREQYVRDSLKQCGISHLAERSPLTLSYGEQHRVALASVIASQPDLLLLDEPFSGLDYEMREAVLDLLSRLNTSFDMSILFASHDPPLDPQWADRQLILKEGKIENA